MTTFNIHKLCSNFHHFCHNTDAIRPCYTHCTSVEKETSTMIVIKQVLAGYVDGSIGALASHAIGGHQI